MHGGAVTKSNVTVHREYQTSPQRELYKDAEREFKAALQALVAATTDEAYDNAMAALTQADSHYRRALFWWIEPASEANNGDESI
jgi:hypothetical protein